MFMFDPMYLLFVIPGLLFSLWASFRTKSAFSKYSRVRVATGLTGKQAAERMLSAAGIQGVEVVPHQGMLSDHYDPSAKKLALSEDVYGVASIAAVGVACHEAGHAIQHAAGYKPLYLRSFLVPTANIGSTVGYLVMSLGLFLMYMSHGRSGVNVILFGAVLFSAVLLFQIVTLPVEYDASARAKKLCVEYGIVTAQEKEGVDRVLDAAALTYVAAAISTFMTLLYYLFRAGLLGGRRN